MIQLGLTHHDFDCVGLDSRTLCGREMFSYLKIECHNRYSIGPLDATGLAVVVVAVAAEAVVSGCH